jgi:hypothetical protein
MRITRVAFDRIQRKPIDLKVFGILLARDPSRLGLGICRHDAPHERLAFS